MSSDLTRAALLTLLICCSTATIGCGGYRTYPVQGIAKLKDGSDIARLAGHAVMFEAVEPGPDGKVALPTGAATFMTCGVHPAGRRTWPSGTSRGAGA